MVNIFFSTLAICFHGMKEGPKRLRGSRNCSDLTHEDVAVETVQFEGDGGSGSCLGLSRPCAYYTTG